MAASGSFKVPSIVAQDVAIIMGFLGPPEPVPSLQEKGKLVRGHKLKGSPNIISRTPIDNDDDISSSCTESEDEVEAQIGASLMTDGTRTVKPIS